MRGLFVTGTDTGVGKTALAAAIVAALRARGVAVKPLKPVITGIDEPASPDWPLDDVLLARAAGVTADEVSLVRYGPAVSPHLAAELGHEPIDPASLVEWIRVAASQSDVVVVEGVGGLLVPLGDCYDVRDLALALALPLLIAARPGLGTINHTLLTLESARSAGLVVASVVITPWPDRPGRLERSNRETIARLGSVNVTTLPPISRPDPGVLGAAAAALPIDAWLG